MRWPDVLRWWLLRAALAVTLMAGVAVAQTGDDLQAMAAQLDAVPGMSALLATCPAKIAGTRPEGQGRVIRSGQACAADPARCANACVKGHSPTACQRLAQVFETASDDTGDPGLEMTARKAYALGCAVGSALACTNRGAGNRNYPVSADPFAAVAAGTRDGCLFATFAATCAAGDPWGCAMSGQTYALGEGTMADPDKARIQFRAACTLTTDAVSAACDFAREGAAALPEN